MISENLKFYKQSFQDNFFYKDILFPVTSHLEMYSKKEDQDLKCFK